MRFIHLADLHLGRRVSGFSLIEDQEHILDTIEQMIAEEKPDAVIIAGDVYDKLSPPVEAVRMLDRFLTGLSESGIPTFIIAGNHDSPERIAFGAQLMNKSGIHFSPVYEGRAEKFTLTDEFGDVDIYLLPYLRPAEVRRFFPDADIPDTEAAVRTAIGAMDIDKSKRNIIVSHQFVAGGTQSDSERGAVGGTDEVSAEVYGDFDYAALGHLHKPQAVGRNIRYGGTPLKYSVSEQDHRKCLTVCELGGKGSDVKVTLRELVPLNDMYELEGAFDELVKRESEDYVLIRLTDSTRVPDAQKRLREQYHHLMGVKYRADSERGEVELSEETPVVPDNRQELFAKFFAEANGKEMTPEQSAYMNALINRIWNEEG